MSASSAPAGSPALQFTYFNAKEGSHTFEWSGAGAPVERVELREAVCSDFLYSDDGQLLGFLSKDGIVVKSSVTGETIRTLTTSKVTAFAFSPRASFIQTFANFSSTDEEHQAGNHVVWSVASGEVVKRVVHKAYSKETWPPIKWTADESVAAQLVNNEILFFAGDNVGGPVVKRIGLEGVRQFSWSPNPKQARICLFVPEKKSQPGSAAIYGYPDVERQLATQSFYNAHDVTFSWNVQATAVLITTHTDYDSSGRSYYGKTALYLLSEATSCQVPTAGQVYSSSWKPNGRHFVVTYGYPARTTMFSLACRPTADFGEAPRNTTLWQPHSQLVGLAGLGSLQGDIDIWDPTELKKVGRLNVHGSKYCAWAPNGRVLMSAVISTGLKVDNGFKIWNYDGKMVYKKELAQLDAIAWRPATWGQYPAPKLDLVYKTDAELAASQASVAYRHPNATAASSTSLAHRGPASGPAKYMPPAKRGAGGIPGDTPKPPAGGIPGDTPKPAAGGIPGDTPPLRGAVGRGRSPAAAAPSDTGESLGRAGEALMRKKRALTKKLRQIDSLKTQAGTGKTLLPAQLSKIESEEEVRQQIKDVDTELAALRR